MAECGGGFATASNVLVRLLRMQQITSGFCEVQPGPGEAGELRELNDAKYRAALDWASDLPPGERLVVFCTFTHDLDMSRRLSEALRRPFFELSGREHRADEWRASEGGLLAVQIRAGAEGVDLTASSRALYWSLPHSLALYEQSACIDPDNYDHDLGVEICKERIENELWKPEGYRKVCESAVRDGE